MRTVGVDLATQAKETAVAVVDWADGEARVVQVEIPADDDAVLRHVAGAAKVGIDCPLGWPEPFVDFLRVHRANAPLSIDTTAAVDSRSLTYRRTDHHVRAVTRLNPLSVSTDRIGSTAIRAARLQALLAQHGHDVDRRGTGSIVEVYPAAALKLWGLPHNRYKGRAREAGLAALVDALTRAAPWLDLADHEPVCRRIDHAFDAVVAALLARAAALGATGTPGDADSAVAATEGWIALPSGSLRELP